MPMPLVLDTGNGLFKAVNGQFKRNYLISSVGICISHFN